MSDGQILHLFGGKGGVGKTTLSAAFALNLSEENPKDKILLVTSDGGEALSDLLKKKLSAKPAKLAPGKGTGGLFAAEFDAKAAREPFLKKYQPALEAAAAKGMVVSADDLRELFKQSYVGLDELAGLFGLVDQLESGEFDRLVIDTAPTARTLRLLDSAVALKRFLGLLRYGEKAVEKAGQKNAKKAETPPGPPSPIDEYILKSEKLLALLKDPAKTAFHLVTLAEPVPEAQTRMYFTQLRERSIPVAEIVVNQAEADTGCQACQGRRGLQAPHVRKLQHLDKTVPVNLVQKREEPPRGIDDLKKFGKAIASGKETKALEFSAAEGPPALVRAPSMPPIAAPPITPTRLIFFVGQGGVGKSSCAAAAAVTLTEKEGPVLLISTDPAHSLSEVLQSRLTDTETQVKGTKGLYARELDVPGWFNALKKRLREKAERVFDPKTTDGQQDSVVLRNLLDAAPPGIEEFAGLSALTDALIQERFKRIVVDPSPALDTVRILELPALANTWLNAIYAVINKYRAKGLGELADDVAGLIKHVKRFEAALASPAESRFVVVTRGEDLASVRTERLVEYLKAKKLAVERVLVNRVLPKSTCDVCENRRKNELNAAKNMEKKIGLPITVAPALGRHPAGLRELKAFRTAWYALSATVKSTKAA